MSAVDNSYRGVEQEQEDSQSDNASRYALPSALPSYAVGVEEPEAEHSQHEEGTQRRRHVMRLHILVQSQRTNEKQNNSKGQPWPWHAGQGYGTREEK